MTGTAGRRRARSGTARSRTGDLFTWIREGQLSVRIGGTYPLADAARAHDDLAARPPVPRPRRKGWRRAHPEGKAAAKG